MEISKLGEFGLIDRLTSDIKPVNASTLLGAGDDCAILGYDGATRQLVTTDLLLEGIHFDLVYTPLRHLGYKAVIVNLSDVYAMNGTPRQITVSLGIDKRLQVEDIEELYAGMRLACERHKVDLVGGDTSSSVTGLTISITCIGDAPEKDVVRRSGAKPTDLICCSGNLGAAYLGLQLLERERPSTSNNSKKAKSLPTRLSSPTSPAANISLSASSSRRPAATSSRLSARPASCPPV